LALTLQSKTRFASWSERAERASRVAGEEVVVFGVGVGDEELID